MLLELVRIRLLLQQIFYDSNKTEGDKIFISFEQRIGIFNLNSVLWELQCSIGSSVVLATVKDYDTSHNNRDDEYTGH